MIRHPFSKDRVGGDCELCGAPADADIHTLYEGDWTAPPEPEDDDFPRTFGALQRPTPRDT